MLKTFLFVIFFIAAGVNSHGKVIDPPNRSTVWRYKETNPFIIPYASIVEENWNDNELFCGGFSYQQSHGGACGLCGDPVEGVRENEAGGKYGKGIIVAQYPKGSIMEVTVQLTAHHQGFFEFRLCNHNDPTTPGTLECLNENLLVLQDGSTRYYPNKQQSTWIYTVPIQLPDHIECTQCILQWRYHAGNTWACDEDNNCCTGCGPQEEFYNCVDIAIGSDPVLPPPDWNKPIPTTVPPKPTTTTTTTPCTDCEITTTTKPRPTTTTTTTPGKPGAISCSNKPPGKYKADCTTFYTCETNGSGPFVYACPPGTVYDDIRQICDYDLNVPPPCGIRRDPWSSPNTYNVSFQASAIIGRHVLISTSLILFSIIFKSW